MPFAATIMLIIGLIGFHASCAWGHGGEDHGPPTRPQQQGSMPSGLGNGAEGDLFEAVITPANDGSTQLYLSDIASNLPIANATIDIEITGNHGWTGKGEATSTIGIYRLNWTIPPNETVDLTLTVSGTKGSDLILVHIPAPPPPPRTVLDSPQIDQWRFLMPGIIILVIVLFGWRSLGKKRGKPRAVVLMAGLLSIIVPSHTHAHGGEDHGAPSQEPAAVAGVANRVVTLPKASQFLLDVRTFAAENREVTQTIRLVGRVIPDPAFHIRIHPQTPSRIGYDPAFPSPRSGQRVKRGQTLAVLDPVLSATDRAGQRLSLFKGERPEITPGREMVLAPIDGQLTDVHLVPGDVVVEADTLAEIVDPDRLWVEAVLYDLSMAEKIIAGTASTRQIPGATFPLVLMGISPKVNPENQGLHIQLAIENNNGKIKLGMPVDVYVHTGSVTFSVAIPRQALFEYGGIPMVWVKTAPEKFEGRPVGVGRKTEAWVEILLGVRHGEKVVVQGHNQLNAIR